MGGNIFSKGNLIIEQWNFQLGSVSISRRTLHEGNYRSKSTVKFHVLNSVSQRTSSEEKLRDVCATIFFINGSPMKGKMHSLLLGVGGSEWVK